MRTTPRTEPRVNAITQAKIDTSSVHIVPEASQPRYVMPPEGACSRKTFQSMEVRGSAPPARLLLALRQSGSALVRQTFSRSGLSGTPINSPEGSFSVNHFA